MPGFMRRSWSHLKYCCHILSIAIGYDLSATGLLRFTPMEMHQIKYFLAVCEALNFTRAAERCNVAQPSLTRAIKLLEEELGGELFRRERNLTHLTALGRLMRPRLETALDQISAARQNALSFLELGKVPSIWA